MNGFKTVMGLIVGILLGVANGLGFKSLTVGIIVGVCFSALFIYIFNKHPRKKQTGKTE